MDDMPQVWVRAARVIRGGSDNDGEPDLGTTPPETPAAPEYVTKADFQAAQAQQAALLAGLNETMGLLREAVVRPAPSAPVVVPAAGVTRAQYIEAMQTGDERVIERYEQQQEARWAETHVAPLRDTGLTAIANMRGELSGASLPYYARFKKDIDKFVEALPPQLRLDPAVYKTAHDAVVGANAATLLQEAKEAALRGASETPESADAGRRGRQPAPKSTVPTPEDLGGREVVQALESRGLDSDAFARRLGYASWEDYMTKTATTEA